MFRLNTLKKCQSVFGRFERRMLNTSPNKMMESLSVLNSKYDSTLKNLAQLTVFGKSGRRMYSTSANKMMESLSVLNSKYDITLKNLAQLTVIGPQSSGKTSLVEAIAGYSIFPKKMDMATMKPFHITTIRDNETKFNVRGKELRNLLDVREELERLNNNSEIENIDIRIHSPDVYTSTIVDLPGLLQISGDDHELPERVRQMNLEYLRKPSSIPIVVTSAASDIATNEGYKILYDSGKKGMGLGVFTKIDTTLNVNTDVVKELLSGDKSGRRSYLAMKYGYHAVVLRNKKEVDAGMTIKEKILEENKFFYDNHEFYPSGVVELREKISKMQLDQISTCIPQIIDEINDKIEHLKRSKMVYDKMMDDNSKKIPKKLRMMFEKLVSSSLDRADFEISLKLLFNEKIKELMNLHPPRPRSINHHQNNTCKYINNIDVKWVEEDKFSTLFNFGLLSPVLVDERTINEAFSDEIILGYIATNIHFHLDDYLGRKRFKWAGELSKAFDKLLKDSNIQQIIYDITQEKILEYIRESDDQNNLSDAFAEHIVKEIGEIAYEEKIRFSIEAVVNNEKRPNINAFELCRKLAGSYAGYFKNINKHASLFHNVPKIIVEVYGDEWTEAYMNIVAERLANNFYRTVTTNFFDIMMEKCLEMVMDMANKETLNKRQNKISEAIYELNNLKSELSKYESSHK